MTWINKYEIPKYENDERIIVLHMKHMRKHIWGSTELCLLLICRTIVKQHNESETNSMSTIKFQHDKNKMRTENEAWRDRRMENDINIWYYCRIAMLNDPYGM